MKVHLVQSAALELSPWLVLLRRSFATVLILVCAGVLRGQTNKITNASGGTLAASIAFGSLVPATGAAVSAGQAQFRLWSSNSSGYRVDAQSTFVVTPSAAANGGDTIAAKDFGFGITSIALGNQVVTPRADVVTAGYDYDPGAVTSSDGLTPYAGASGGQATLADLLASKRILYGNRIGSNTNGNRYLDVTVRVGVVPQYFTPASFSGVITLTISNGP